MDIYRVTHFGPSIGIGVSGAVHLGIAAVGKPNGPVNRHVIPNELIAAEIGRYLRLPVPPFCIIAGPNGESHFASLNFNLVGQEHFHRLFHNSFTTNSGHMRVP